METADDILGPLLRRIQQETEEFQRALPCGLDPARLSSCADEWAGKCPGRRRSDCPRRMADADADRLRQRRMSALHRGVSERILRRIFDMPPRETPALAVVRAFMGAEQSILVLSGTNATGKTTAAAWACIPPVEEWPDGHFLRAVDLESAGRFSETLIAIREARLVVLDDIGAAHFGGSGWMGSLVDDVVDAVYTRCNKLIITTDLSSTDFAKLMSRRVLSRIKDSGIIETKLGGRLS